MEKPSRARMALNAMNDANTIYAFIYTGFLIGSGVIAWIKLIPLWAIAAVLVVGTLPSILMIAKAVNAIVAEKPAPPIKAKSMPRDVCSAPPAQPPILEPILSAELTDAIAVGPKLEWYSCNSSHVEPQYIHFRATSHQEAESLYKRLRGINEPAPPINVYLSQIHKPSTTDLERDKEVQKLRAENPIV